MNVSSFALSEVLQVSVINEFFHFSARGVLLKSARLSL